MRVDHRIVRGLCTFFAGLAACGGTASLGDQPTLSGKIENWNQGEGYTLQATAFNNQPMLGAAPIDAAGNFSITLAGQDVLAGHLVPVMPSSLMTGMTAGCNGTVRFDPTPIFESGLTLRVVKGTSTFQVKQSTPDDMEDSFASAGYIFVEADASQTGSADCDAPGGIRTVINYDVHLKRGWNRQISATVVTPSLVDIRNYTGDVPEGVVWIVK